MNGRYTHSPLARNAPECHDANYGENGVRVVSHRTRVGGASAEPTLVLWLFRYVAPPTHSPWRRVKTEVEPESARPRSA